MSKQLLFIHGAGEGAYTEDTKLVERLQRELGPSYTIEYPAMPNEADPSYEQWRAHIEKVLASMSGPVGLVGHSIGSSVLAKLLSEMTTNSSIAGVFLMATPFWGGDGWHYDGYEELELTEGLAAQLPRRTPLFLYHCRDDQVVPYQHLALYEKLLPHAVSRSLDEGGHQFDSGFGSLVQDIKAL